MGGCSSASSMAVMPTAQMSHSWLYPPFLSTAATSGAILQQHTPIGLDSANHRTRQTDWINTSGSRDTTEKHEAAASSSSSSSSSSWETRRRLQAADLSVTIETTNRRGNNVVPVRRPDEGFPLSDGHSDLSRHAEVRCQHTQSQG